MARRDRNDKNQPEANLAEASTEEAAVTADTTEAPAAAEATEAPAAATKPAEVPIDLTAFKAAVDSAVGESDESTGTVPEASLAAVTKAYRELDGAKPKNAAKAEMDDRLKDAVNALDMVRGRAYMQVREALTAGASGSGKEKAPADPTEAYVQRVVTLNLASSLVSVPEGVDESDATSRIETQISELSSQAEGYLAWTNGDEDSRGDEPDVSALVKSAVKLATGKSARVGGGGSGNRAAFTGERRDIGKHITEAFSDKNSGDFLTIAEIRNFKSSEYGDSPPSAGAISARLFPSSGNVSVEGITPDTNEKGHRGAKKA